MRKKDGVLLKVSNKDIEILKTNPDMFWKGVEVIGSNAFKQVSALEELNVPSSVKEIRSMAVVDCHNLKKIVIPSNCNNIQNFAFCGCKSLNEVVFEDGLEKVSRMFDKCDVLEKLVIPSSVKSLGPVAGLHCRNLTTIEISEGVEFIEEEAFREMESIENIVIPSSVKKIGACAFKDCAYLTNLKIKEGVQEIGDKAFENCSRLNEIVIPGSIKKVGDFAFNGCKKLNSITFEKGVQEIGVNSFSDTGINYIIINSGIEKIDKYAFESCEHLKEVIIEPCVKTIEKGAFYRNKNMEIIVLPFSTEVVGSAFDNPYESGKYKYINHLNENTTILSTEELKVETIDKTYSLEEIEESIIDFPYYMYINKPEKLDYYCDLAKKYKDYGIKVSFLMFYNNKEKLERFVENSYMGAYKKIMDLVPEDMSKSTLRGLCKLCNKIGVFEDESKTININGIEMPVSYCAYKTLKEGLIKGVFNYSKLHCVGAFANYENYSEDFLKKCVMKVKNTVPGFKNIR